MGDPASAQFFDRGLRRSKAIACGVVVVVLVLLLVQMARGVSALVAGYMAVVGILVAVFVVGTLRALRVGIELDDERLTVRQTWTTRSWRLGEIARVRTQDRTRIPRGVAINPIPGRGGIERIQVLPIVDLANGRTVLLYGLRTSLGAPTDFSWVDEAFSEVNDRLEARRRAAGGASATPS